MMKEKVRMELNSLNNSVSAQKENVKLEIPVNNESIIDLKPTSIEDKLKFIVDKKLAHISHRVETRQDEKHMDKEMVRGKELYQPYERSPESFDLENPTSKISDLIKFFKNDVQSGDQIYAHKEFVFDEETG
jgi:hypothetical protein